LPSDDAEKSVSETFAPPSEDQINIAELQRMSMKDLIAIAERDQLTEYHGLKKQDLIFRILKERTRLNGLMFGEGTLEILAFCAARIITTCPALTTFTSVPVRSGVLDCEPVPQWLARFDHRRKTSGILRCCGWKRSTGRIRTC
jgi:hypothetical protein